MSKKRDLIFRLFLCVSVIPLAGFLNILSVDELNIYKIKKRVKKRQEEADSNPFSAFKSLGFTACSSVWTPPLQLPGRLSCGHWSTLSGEDGGTA